MLVHEVIKKNPGKALWGFGALFLGTGIALATNNFAAFPITIGVCTLLSGLGYGIVYLESEQ